MTNDFPPVFGGVQQYLYNLAANLPTDRVTVLAPAAARAEPFDGHQPFEIVRDADTSLRPSPRVARTVRSLIRSRGIDVVAFGHALPLALLGPGIAARGTPYVVCTHGSEYWMALLPGLAAPLRWATSRASRVLAITRVTARALSRAVPEHVPISLLPPGVDVDRFHPDTEALDLRARFGLRDGPLILSPSRLVPRKGHDVLLRAMPRLIRTCDATLVIVGRGGYEGRLRRLASRLPRRRVAFAGAVPDAELPGCYAAADLVAVPCRSRFLDLEVEGFGIVYLEAAASGKAAVGGRSGGTDEAIEHGVTGLLVDGTDASSVGEAIGRLLRDPGWRVAMGRAGRARAEERFAWPTLADRFSAVLREATR